MQLKKGLGEEVESSADIMQAIERDWWRWQCRNGTERDPDFPLALEIIRKSKSLSSFLQRKMKIGYNKAARLIDELYEAGASASRW
jgi:DNA segregation ATPase FtsK/SpoIIIE-like protein